MNQQRGMTLIEILVAVLVLSVSVLGVVAMQTNALRFNQASLNHAQATYAATDILDRMRANRTAALGGSYNIALSDAIPTAGSSVASSDLSQWRTIVATLLPAGSGSVAIASNVVTVTIQWDERRAENVASETLKTFKFTSEL